MDVRLIRTMQFDAKFAQSNSTSTNRVLLGPRKQFLRFVIFGDFFIILNTQRECRCRLGKQFFKYFAFIRISPNAAQRN